MALALFPGIRFDPREPVPPRFAHLAEQQEARHDYTAQWHRDLPPWGCRPDPDPPRPHRILPHRREQAQRPVEPDESQLHEGFLPPLSSSVKVQVVHDTAKFTVVHLFWNQSSHIKQGVYQFPLPLDATVTEFSCRIGLNKIVRGKVKAKEDARREFDDAVRRGRAGGLVEQQTAEIFTINLANIPANTKMRAELSFMCLLKHRVFNSREVFTLTVPTFIAPRYGSVPPGVRTDTQNNHYLSLEVDVLTAEELVSVNSDTHDIIVGRSGGQRACQTWDDFVMRRDNDAANLRMATVQLEHGRTSLDGDMVVTIATALSDNIETPLACLETHPDLEHHKALMLTLPSGFLLTAESFAHDGEIVFVADRSGSMYGNIESLKSAMMFFINGIPEGRPFNIWCFGSNFISMWPRSKVLTEGAKHAAIDYVRHEFAADMGGTDILPALKNIYETRGGYHSMDVVLLTDGEVWDPQKTIDYVKEKRLVSEGTFRCFSLGIGHSVSHELVEGIAKAGGGYAEVIASASGGGWEDRVVAVLKAAMTGHVGSVQMELEWQTDGAMQPAKFKQSPANISAISPFVRNRVFLLLDSGAQCPELQAVALKVKGPDGNVTTKRVLPKRLLLADATIHKLAVRALLGDLERGESWLHGSQGQTRHGAADTALVREEAVNLGCKWSLVSRWTSLYAVEEETADTMEDLHIDLELSEDAGEAGDALLQPRGVANQNVRLLGQRGATGQEEAGSIESDGSDSGSTVEDESQGTRDGDSDDDSDNDGDTPGYGGPGGAAGQHEGDGGSDFGGHPRGEDWADEGSDEYEGSSGEAQDSDAPQARGDCHGEDWADEVSDEYVGSSGEAQDFDAHQEQGHCHGPSSASSSRAAADRTAPVCTPRSGAVEQAHDDFALAAGPSHQSWESTAGRERDPSPNASPYPWPSASTAMHKPKRWGMKHRETRRSAPQDSPGAVRHRPGGATFSQQIGSQSSTSTPKYARKILGQARASTEDLKLADESYDSPERTLGGSSSADDRRVMMSMAPPPEPVEPPGYQTSAPVYNPPASSYVIEDVGSVPKTVEELAAEQLVRDLLVFQRSDGGFVFGSDAEIKTTLGPSFFSVAAGLRAKLDVAVAAAVEAAAAPRAQKTVPDALVTVAVVALLEAQLQACEALWVLMARKARDYIAASALGQAVDELMHEARGSMMRMASVVGELERARSAAGTVDELLTAPTVC